VTGDTAAPQSGGATPRLALSGITKAYPSVAANDNVDLTVFPGEIHAVLGENGAGKSTLMKVIYGVVKPDAGEVRWEGRPVVVASPAHARELGIDMVFQHFSLFETLTVVENVALGLPGRADLGELSGRIATVSEKYGLSVDPRRIVHSLSVGERQRVEITRCLLQTPKLLILDEPTSVLTPQAVRKLFATLRRLAAEGCSILYISHKLDEIRELCQTATVMRAGRVTGRCVPSRETPESMARLMIGKDLPHAAHGAPTAGGEVRLKLAGLSHASDDPFGTDLEDLHLEVRAGEIVGIAGVSGNGQQELLRAISGEEPIAEKFPVQICGVEAGRMGPGRRRRLGLCFVPEERLGRGAVPNMSLSENALLTTARTKGFVRGGLIDFGAARALSGGNLQKYIVGREIRQDPKVLVIAQPTWGLDVGAAAFIRQAIVDLRNRGCAVLAISEELDELFEICDRIAVIAAGRLSPAKRAGETNIEEIGVWMSGMWPGGEGAGEPSRVDA
jgi:ABC-type uncharacterized transport system ATPase subunit